ncbi:AAA family ATPase [Armatimonas rosea]|uniref:AAA15 family ATPase/GTPase n=1 Tax=Armatimonas rosea TaxID=685828 RepID=A0A7W9SL30_ARMRO|nr:AAA family ATPase [Armatimonas rosea]MBB6048622.1 AAA15 family ATPase/GTPase [Armatimonas rosea]
MYIKKLEIENIRSIKKLAWEVEEKNCPGWHVFLGENGTGKTTVVRCFSIMVMDRDTISAMRQDWNRWQSNAFLDSKSSAAILIDDEYDDIRIDKSVNLGKYRSNAKFYNKSNLKSEFKLVYDEDRNISEIQIRIVGDVDVEIENENSRMEYYRHGFVSYKGMFCCAYGPFRRFEGGEVSIEKQSSLFRKNEQYLTAFGEKYSLYESLSWLRELKFKELESGVDSEESKILLKIINFINQNDFLPSDIKIESVSSEGIKLIDKNTNNLNIEDLSDGYRSILSLAIDIVRHINKNFRDQEIFYEDNGMKIISKGVILIDEVDAHLHPTWQKKIGFWFRRAFPNMQFIVTTHSPLVCQAAAMGGSVYKLPAPGSDEEGRMLERVELNKILYGDILDAYDTPAFGLPDTRSELGEDMIEELAQLNRKERKTPLTPEEKERQAELRATFPALANE